MANFDLGKSVRSFRASPALAAYTGVLIRVGQDDDGNDIAYMAGDQTGTVLEIENEWGSQAQADAIYRKIKGTAYQPFEAPGARIDPTIEIGDTVTVSGVTGGVYLRATTFGRHPSIDLEAPATTEIDREFQVKSPSVRKYERFVRETRSNFKIQANQISAKVEQTGGDPKSFGWELLADRNVWKANNKEVFRIDKNGAEVTGIIRATGGKIGDLDIGSDGLSYNGLTWASTSATGFYAGRNGIKLGDGFRVDMTGHLEANSGTFAGTVYAGNIAYGDDYGKLDGDGIVRGSIYGSRLVANTVSTSYTSSGINTSLGYADFANGVFNDYNSASVIRCDSLRVGGSYFNPVTIYYTNASGGTSNVTVLGYR